MLHKLVDHFLLKRLAFQQQLHDVLFGEDDVLDLIGCVEAFSAELPVQLLVGHLSVEKILVEEEIFSVVLQQFLSDFIVEVGISQFLIFTCNARNEEEVLKTNVVAFFQLHAEVRDALHDLGMCHLDLHDACTALSGHWPAFDEKIILLARVVEHNGDDLEERTRIDFEQSLHEVYLRDDVEHFMSDVMPYVLLKVTFRESLAQQQQSNHPEELVADVDRGFLEWLPLVEVRWHVLKIEEVLARIDFPLDTVFFIFVLFVLDLLVEVAELTQRHSRALLALSIDAEVEKPS